MGGGGGFSLSFNQVHQLLPIAAEPLEIQRLAKLCRVAETQQNQDFGCTGTRHGCPVLLPASRLTRQRCRPEWQWEYLPAQRDGRPRPDVLWLLPETQLPPGEVRSANQACRAEQCAHEAVTHRVSAGAEP